MELCKAVVAASRISVLQTDATGQTKFDQQLIGIVSDLPRFVLPHPAYYGCEDSIRVLPDGLDALLTNKPKISIRVFC